MTGRLNGKTAVITGGTSGLGLETAKHYVAEGARVIVTGSNPQKIDAAVASLGDQAEGIVADVRSRADMAALAERVKEQFGGLDILFANAGLGNFVPISQASEEAFDTQFDVNVKGVFNTVQALVPLMSKGGSVILNASGVHGKGMAGGSIYFATKAAVRSFARTFAAEFGEAGIRVNSLSPGLVMTPFMERTGNSAEELEGFGTQVVGITPLSRLGQPDEIAQAAVFLASDESSYMTASDLVVDGGFMNV